MNFIFVLLSIYLATAILLLLHIFTYYASIFKIISKLKAKIGKERFIKRKKEDIVIDLSNIKLVEKDLKKEMFSIVLIDFFLDALCSLIPVFNTKMYFEIADEDFKKDRWDEFEKLLVEQTEIEMEKFFNYEDS